MKPFSLTVAVCMGAFVSSIGAFAADRPHAINPADVGTVRAFARGQGGLGPPSGDCSATACSEQLSVTFDHGTAVLRGVLAIPIEVQREVDPFTLCSKFKGSGTLGDQLAVQIVGELCNFGGIRYSLSASMQVYENTAQCACQDAAAASGRLEMFGAIKTFGPTGLPYTLPSIATFTGGAGRPAVCCP